MGATLRLFETVREAVPGRALVLGEFGISTTEADEQQAAMLETALILGVRDRGGSGALKWMLNDVPNGFDPRENAFGLYRADGSPKPVVEALRAFGEIEPRAPAPEQPETEAGGAE